MEENFSFGYWLRRQRLARDIRQADLAAQLGVAAITLRKIEADERRPSLQLIERLAEIFQLSEDERASLLQVARADLSPAALPLPARAADLGVTDPAPSPALPSGTVSFLFTDIAGSTRLWEQHAEAMRPALARHDAILRAAVVDHGGVVVKGTGDGILAAFALAEDGLAAAVEAQRALQAADWGQLGSLRVRMALHSGAAELQDGDYFGPTLNRAARLLAAGHGGQILLSLAAVELLRDHLPGSVELRDLGSHLLKDLTRAEQIFQVVVPDLPADFPPLRTLDARRHNLPAQSTALIGREREVAELGALLRGPGVRLVTLTGPGGTGKTRLALQAAAELIEQFPQGVWFVNLAPLSDPDLVIPAIAQTLDVRAMGGRSLAETLRDALRDQQLLLVLDNFEQIIPAAVELAALLAAAPGLKLLVTSREALHLSGEQQVAVPPLGLPDLRQTTVGQAEPAALSQYAAVQLFIERARAVRADFAVTNANAPAVAEICARLDGLPLAIELAAARVRLFTPEALLGRLDQRLQLLTGGPRDQPARQQTLRNAIEWSYALLSQQEQSFFRQLGIFVGGWGLAGAAAVGRIDQIEALDLLAALVDKSLLREGAGPDGEPRFTMLETIREYALEQLERAGEAAAAGERHAGYCLELAESVEPQLRAARSTTWMDLLQAEHENLRAALEWLQTYGNHSQVVRLCYALWRYWYDRGHWIEGRQALELSTRPEALEHVSVELQARALLFAGMFLSRQSEFERAQALLTQGLDLFRRQGDKAGQIDILYSLAIVRHGLSDYSGAADHLREAVQLGRESGDRYRTALCLDWSNYALYVQGDVQTAEAQAREALAIFQELEIADRIGAALGNLAFIIFGRGDLAEATRLLDQSIAMLRPFGISFDLSSGLNYLAQVSYTQGDVARAVELFHEAFDMRRRLGDRRGSLAVLVGLAVATFAIGERREAYRQLGEALALTRALNYTQGFAWCLRVIAEILVLAGNMDITARVISAEDAYSRAHQIPHWPDEQPIIDTIREQARAALGDEAFDLAWAAGRALSLDEALDLGMAGIERASLSQPAPEREPQ